MSPRPLVGEQFFNNSGEYQKCLSRSDGSYGGIFRDMIRLDSHHLELACQTVIPYSSPFSPFVFAMSRLCQIQRAMSIIFTNINLDKLMPMC